MRRQLQTTGLIALLALTGCGGGQTDILFECPSPDGSRIATLYRISDGPTDINAETRLNLRPANAALDAGMFSFSMRHGFDAVIRWRSDERVELVYPQDSVLMHQEHVIFGSSQTFAPEAQIHVDYREERSNHGYFMVEQRCFNKE